MSLCPQTCRRIGCKTSMPPTSRAARFSGGLGVADFLKRTSLVSCTPEALAALGPSALVLAGADGLEAHGRSISIRLNRRG